MMKNLKTKGLKILPKKNNIIIIYEGDNKKKNK